MTARQDMDDTMRRSRRNVLLAWVHVALAAVILAAFVYMRTQA